MANPLTNREKALPHIYRDACRIPEAVYRDLLDRTTGCSSMASESMTRTGFEQAMAALEELLWLRVSTGATPDPIGYGHRTIKSRDYWRRKAHASGVPNARQVHMVKSLWNQLKPLLPERQRTTIYLAGIIARATGREPGEIGLAALTPEETGDVISALRGRLAQEQRRGQTTHR